MVQCDRLSSKIEHSQMIRFPVWSLVKSRLNIQLLWFSLISSEIILFTSSLTNQLTGDSRMKLGYLSARKQEEFKPQTPLKCLWPAAAAAADVPEEPEIRASAEFRDHPVTVAAVWRQFSPSFKSCRVWKKLQMLLRCDRRRRRRRRAEHRETWNSVISELIITVQQINPKTNLYKCTK